MCECVVEDEAQPRNVPYLERPYLGEPPVQLLTYSG
jgi:hypothetical protein